MIRRQVVAHGDAGPALGGVDAMHPGSIGDRGPLA
jgi:hypothetical protein